MINLTTQSQTIYVTTSPTGNVSVSSSPEPATQAEVNAGTNSSKFVSPKTLASYSGLGSGSSISGLTAGRVPYAASATSLTDSVSLSWDNTNLKLTVGTHFVQSHATGIYIGKNLGKTGMNTGVYNVVIGEDLGLAFTTATRNILIGHDAGRAITSSQYNIAIGEAALRLSTTAGENVAIGYRALYAATGEDNVGIGFAAAQGLSGSGRNNVFIGYYAGSRVQSGASGTSFIDGDGSIFIGGYTDAPSSADGVLNIQNAIFGTGNYSSNPPPLVEVGNIGIYVPAPTARLHVIASSTSAASLRIPHGTAPSSPNDGDIWTTTAGLFVRINGVTVGPLS